MSTPPTILFNASPLPSPRFSTFDTQLDNDFRPSHSIEGIYDPYSPREPLIPNRISRTHIPQQLSLTGSRYHDFDPYPTQKQEHLTPSTSSETDFLKTPSSALFPMGHPKPPRRHPFATGFEAPEWWSILIHIALCALAYPVLYAFVVIATNRPIFWSRLLVGAGCGAVGVSLGWSLTRLGQRFLEAATWATLINQSRASQDPGISLRSFAKSAESSTSIMSGVRLLFGRCYKRQKSDQQSARSQNDSRSWSAYVVVFLVILAIASSLPFILGRVVDIQASIEHQHVNYFEVAIAADLSDEDISRAAALNTNAFNNYALTWTIAPFSTHGTLPSPVSFTWENDTVYFSETILSQVLPGGTGFGTFDANTTAASIDLTSTNQPAPPAANSINPGWTLRYPRWGLRIHCVKSSDPNTIVPKAASGLSYVYTPRETLRSLFSSFGKELPANLETPLNITKLMMGNDTFPASLKAEDIALGAVFWDNGVAHSFKSTPISEGEDGAGFASIETLLVRLNTTYAPQGTFLTHSEVAVPDVHGANTFIGYDSAVCLELYEPYVLDTYNSTAGFPASMRIVNKGNAVVDVINREKNTQQPLRDPTLKRELLSSNLRPVYEVAHENSANQILKDNGRDAYYVLSPTLLSFTGGDGPRGYLELSAPFFAQARALADASNVLTYLVGSGQTVARCYPDRITTTVRIATRDAVVVLATVLVLGLLAGLFVPRLPFAIPRRGFGLYSWLAGFYSNELVLGRTEARPSEGIPKHLELEEIKRHMGDLKFRYVV
ncbi:hypothetical protein MIND_00692000 [Mycena indigotica]|uniref:Uncharacterized protein n=1 Tax=Mycena indigotica TaxID=2126181 RepID=A0A8H6SN34_9AGAR|nr:uncharacterized protein MIND_00692000 [Mycena indigotica]KAF7301272.1 hypothetical protein MIND_00692000 [Mycena indigotica]